MIHLYGLTYRAPEYLRKSLDSIIQNSSEDLDITIVESNSEKSPEVRKVIESYVFDKSQIGPNDKCRAMLMPGNTVGWGLLKAIDDFPPDSKDADFFILTDLDLIVPTGCDWVSLIREAHEVRGRTLTGCTLSLENYVPPNHGYGGDSDSFGMWLMGVNIKQFKDFPRNPHHPSCALVDHHVRGFFQGRGITEKLLSIRLYHLGWDIWKDDPDYFEHKKANPTVWFQLPRSLDYELLEAK